MVDTDYVRQLAWTAHCAGELGQAETYYRQLLAQWPDQRDAINLGALLRRTGRLNEAAEHYRTWIPHWPQEATLRLNGANCLRELGQAHEALDLVEPLLEHNPKDLSGLGSSAKSLLALTQLQACQHPQHPKTPFTVI